jgi:hypothetical protein
MRNLLAAAALLVILAGTLGWCRSWYNIASAPADGGRYAFRVEVDGLKVCSDVMDLLRYAHSKFTKEKDEKAGEAK